MTFIPVESAQEYIERFLYQRFLDKIFEINRKAESLMLYGSEGPPKAPAKRRIPLPRSLVNAILVSRGCKK